MRVQSLEALESFGFEPLDRNEMVRLDGGIPWVYYGYAVGVYVLKTIGDNWGAFKAGMRRGFEEMWYGF